MVDGIRYAILQKLAPGMRHVLMGELQTIQFSAELAARLIERSGLLSTELSGYVTSLPTHTLKAVDTSRGILEWLRPDEDALDSLRDIFLECARIAGDDWPLRAIHVQWSGAPSPVPVRKAAAREVLSGALFALIDTSPGALDLVLSAEASADGIALTITTRSAQRTPVIGPPTHTRRLTLSDVELLARARGVAFAGDGVRLTLGFARVADR